MAAVAAALGQSEQAMRLYLAAEVLERTLIRDLGFVFDRDDYARHLAFVRERLEKVMQTIASAETDTMTVEEALAYAAREAAALMVLSSNNSQ